MTLEEQLQQVNEAITAIEVGGQEYWIEGRRLRRADLDLLYKRQKQLLAQINYENNPGSVFPNTSVSVFDRR
ncbi:peptidylprolyl isomerase [Domibacillus antri]|uniref:Peptidylprolyl isomerase n=1 Tax=Domibacillus antri TaxID=1714264 RepID=A0A1Q8Q280_9BACI|nr:peptidylprolyl isomerase [Domibacillus antri]OLN21411.1 peptidylprolyl isomerase [Domibacillus antri]